MDKSVLIFMCVVSVGVVLAPVVLKQGPLAVGSVVPDFSLSDETGKSWSFKQHKGHPMVIYFYPADGTSHCTEQACSIRNSYGDFSKLGIKVVGISYDSVASHKKFKEKNGLPFTLLSDPTARVAKLFGASRWWPNLVPQRKTFIIDRSGKVRHILENVDVAKHSAQVIALVRGL